MVNKVTQTYAMLQGLEQEDAIANSFIDKMEEEGNHNFTFIRYGFFIIKTHGFLGASPDPIVHDLTEETTGVAEFIQEPYQESDQTAHLCKITRRLFQSAAQ